MSTLKCFTAGSALSWQLIFAWEIGIKHRFDKGDAAPLAYDSSEKQRVPAWCDRILFRGSELTRTSAQVGMGLYVSEVHHLCCYSRQSCTNAKVMCGRSCGIDLLQDAQHDQEPDEPEPALEAEEIRVGCSDYISVPAAVESDHKPVLARLAISMPVTDQVTLERTSDQLHRREQGSAGAPGHQHARHQPSDLGNMPLVPPHQAKQPPAPP